MHTQEMHFLIPPYGTATLRLPELLSVDGFQRLQAAVGAALGEPLPASDPPPASDPGAIEFDSWRAQLRPAGRVA